MQILVYADFSCPSCYLASRRADALTRAGVDIDWRALEHDPQRAVSGRRLVGPTRSALEHQLRAVTDLLLPGEELPFTVPDLVTKTEAAVSGYAEAHGAGVGPDVRRLLFAAYWTKGIDIGDPNVLRRLLPGPILRGTSTSDALRRSGFAVGVNRDPITTSAWRRIRDWREQWRRLDRPALPAVLVPGESLASGEQALRRLEKELVRSGARLDPDLPDPARYPAPAVRPPRDWVSRVGGRWTYTWMGDQALL